MGAAPSVLVAGAGGFIGGHLVRRLLSEGHDDILAVDIKPLNEWWQLHETHEGVRSLQLDLSRRDHCAEATSGRQVVYNLACNMGGMGFIENNKAQCMLSVLVNTHLLMAAEAAGVERYFYSSSACVYPDYRQDRPDIVALKESDAYPAAAEDGYGWEKLFSERMCRHFTEDFGLPTRVARYHNVYGPNGTWTGGREKAPAAICRKVAEAKLSGRHSIEIWGDGEQTRSFMYVDDCIEGTLLLTASQVAEPLNIGSAEMVTITQLVDLVEGIAGFELDRRYNLAAPQGVRGRSSENALIRGRLGWEPSISLSSGLERTYRWVHDQVAKASLSPAVP